MTTSTAKPATAPVRILAWLTEHKTGRFADICAGAGLGAGTTSAALKSLVEADKIRKLEPGLYGLPPTCPPHHWQAPPPSGPMLRLVCQQCGSVTERPNTLYGPGFTATLTQRDHEPASPEPPPV